MIKLSHLLMEATKHITPEQSYKLFRALGLDKTAVDPEQFHMGLVVSLPSVRSGRLTVCHTVKKA